MTEQQTERRMQKIANEWLSERTWHDPQDEHFWRHVDELSDLLQIIFLEGRSSALEWAINRIQENLE